MTDERILQHIRIFLCYDWGTGGVPMKFKLIIDKTKEEEVAVTVHERSSLTEQIEALVMQHTGSDRIITYSDDEMKQLSFDDISAIAVLGRNKLNIYVNDKIYQVKSHKRFNAVKYMNLYYRYSNVKKGEPYGEFLGI